MDFQKHQRKLSALQGKINEDGISLLRRLCVEVRSRHPGVLLSAEESTNFKWASDPKPSARVLMKCEHVGICRGRGLKMIESY